MQFNARANVAGHELPNPFKGARMAAFIAIIDRRREEIRSFTSFPADFRNKSFILAVVREIIFMNTTG